MKLFIGKVISTEMKDTATVAVQRVVVHPVYEKRFRRVKKYHVHDEIGAQVGQVVTFAASKPYSKLKKWKIVEVVEDKKTLPAKKKVAAKKGAKNDTTKK